MRDKRLRITIIVWFLIILLNYYKLNGFLLWLPLIFYLFFITIYQYIETFRERKILEKVRIQKTIVYTLLFILALTCDATTNRFIEKIDWLIFYNIRKNIVVNVLEKKYNPNIEYNSNLFELPFCFPLVSNDNNRIVIYRNDTGKTQAVEFFIEHNWYEEPSARFVFSNDKNTQLDLNALIIKDKKHNWKIKENWYRISY